MKKLLFMMLSAFSIGATAQVTFNGNGNSGFGGAVGGSSLSVSHTGTTITFSFTRGSGDFENTMVLYISNGSAGRNIIDGNVNDNGDANRRAISNIGSGTLTFPAGFNATHAVAINTGFGGLWSIASTGTIGSNQLGFVRGVGQPATTNAASFNFSFDWTDIGITSNDQFGFVVTYGNPNDNGNMFSADEAIGGGIGAGNPGFGAMTFTTYFQYPSGLRGGNASTAGTGTWSTVANWTNGNLPLSTDAITLNHSISVDGDYSASSVAISTGNTLTINADERLSVTGGVTGAGSFVVNGIFRLNAGGFTTIVPTYGAGTSQLTYNTGGNYNISSEWPAASSPASIRIINSAVVLSGNRNVTGILNIESGGSLDVNGNVLSLKATSESDYSQLLNNGTLTGNVTFERAITGSTAGWRFVSPAVTSTLANLGTVQLTGAANVIQLNTANPNAWVAQGGAGSDALVAGRGYALYFGGSGVNNNTVATTLSLTGSIQNADVTVAGLSNGDGGNDFGWTLVGNPYPTGLDWSNVNHIKTNIADAYYIWNPTLGGSGQYASFVSGVSNPGGVLDANIPPMQAFLVKATAASPVLTFSAQARTSAAEKAQMRTSSINNRMAVRVTNLQNQQWDEATLVSRATASAAYEDDFDAFKINSFNADAINLSSLSSDQRKLSINSLGVWDYQTSVPLYLQASQAVAMQLNVDLTDVDPVIPVFLEDVLSNQLHDLRSGPYGFVNQPAQRERFIIHFHNAATTSITTNSLANALIYVYEGSLYAKGLSGETDVRILDMQGRQVYAASNLQLEQGLQLPSFAKGTYLVQVQGKEGVKTVKVIF